MYHAFCALVPAQLKSVDENYGTVVLDGEVRRGYRIKVMVSEY